MHSHVRGHHLYGDAWLRATAECDGCYGGHWRSACAAEHVLRVEYVLAFSCLILRQRQPALARVIVCVCHALHFCAASCFATPDITGASGVVLANCSSSFLPVANGQKCSLGCADGTRMAGMQGCDIAASASGSAECRQHTTRAGDGNMTCTRGQFAPTGAALPRCMRPCPDVNCAVYTGPNGLPMVNADAAGVSASASCADDGSDCQALCCLPGMVAQFNGLLCKFGCPVRHMNIPRTAPVQCVRYPGKGPTLSTGPARLAPQLLRQSLATSSARLLPGGRRRAAPTLSSAALTVQFRLCQR